MLESGALVKKILVLVAFWALCLAGCSGGGGDDGDGSGGNANVANIAGTYEFSRTITFDATSYSGTGQCISSFNEDTSESPYFITQNGDELTVDRNCAGYIDDMNNVEYSCGDTVYQGVYDPATGEIAGTVSGTMDVRNGNCTSTGDVDGTFSLTPL